MYHENPWDFLFVCLLHFVFQYVLRKEGWQRRLQNSRSPVSKQCLTEMAIHDGFNSNFLFPLFSKNLVGLISIGPFWRKSLPFYECVVSQNHPKQNSRKSPVWSFKFFQLEYTFEFLSEFKMVRRLIDITYHILVKLFICLITFLSKRIPKSVLEMLMTFIKTPI